MLLDIHLQSQDTGRPYADSYYYYIGNVTPGSTVEETTKELEERYEVGKHFMSPELRNVKIQGSLLTFTLVYPYDD